MTLTNDKLVFAEGDLERTKRQVGIKESEITRLTNDFQAEHERLMKEVERVNRLQQLLKNQENASFNGEDQLFNLELEVSKIIKILLKNVFASIHLEQVKSGVGSLTK